MFKGGKVNILTKEINAKKFNQSQKKNSAWKKAFFGHTLIQAVEAKNAWTWFQNVHLFTNV